MEGDYRMKQNQDSPIDRLVRKCVEERTVEELAVGWLRYETLRRLSPQAFKEIDRRNKQGETFDDIVTQELLKWKEPDGTKH